MRAQTVVGAGTWFRGDSFVLQLAVAKLDVHGLLEALLETLDFDPENIRAELQWEFERLSVVQRQPRLPSTFLGLSPKGRALVSALHGKGQVPVPDVLRAVYGSADRKQLRALEKLKDRTNAKLAQEGLPWEVRKQGDTLVLAPIESAAGQK